MTVLSYSSGGQKSNMGEAGQVPSGDGRGEPFSLPFPASRAHLPSLIHGPFFHLQSMEYLQISLSMTFVYVTKSSLVLTLLSRLSLVRKTLSCKNACDYLGLSTQVTQDNLPSRDP